MGDVRAASEDFATLAGYAREQGLAAEEARALLQLGSALSWIDRDRSLAAVERALALAPRTPRRSVAWLNPRVSVSSASCSAGGGTRTPRRVARAIDAARHAGDRRASQPARRPLGVPAESPVGVPSGGPHRRGGPAAGAGGERRLSLHDLPVPPRVGAAAPRRMGGDAPHPPRRAPDGGAKRASPLGAGVPIPDGVAAHARRGTSRRRARSASASGRRRRGPAGPVPRLDRPRVRPARG